MFNKVTQCPLCKSTRWSVKHRAKPSIVAREVTSENYMCTSFDHSFQYDILKCLSCGHVFSEAVPDEQLFKKFYSHVEDDLYVREMKHRECTFNYLLDKIEKTLSREVRKNYTKLLEIGSYYGAFLKLARDREFIVAGVEPSFQAARYAREKYGVQVFDEIFQKWEAPEGCLYDVIVMWDVFEHLSDPIPFLKKLITHLRPGGYLFLTTMDIATPLPILLGRHWPWFMTMHVNYYSSRILTDLMGRFDLSEVTSFYYPHFVSVRYLMQKVSKMYQWLSWICKPISNIPRIADASIPFNGYDNIFMAFKYCKKNAGGEVINMKLV